MRGTWLVGASAGLLLVAVGTPAQGQNQPAGSGKDPAGAEDSSLTEVVVTGVRRSLGKRHHDQT